LISHLSLNYLSIADGGAAASEPRGQALARAGGPAAQALRELLALYAELGDAAARKQIAGVRSVTSRPVTRALPGAGALCFGRGLEVSVECDEAAFQGGSAFLLGAVLERFFAKYVSINSFTETALRSVQRGEIMRWPTTLGQRHLA
jgi:type VI secretion system protein ImpG